MKVIYCPVILHPNPISLWVNIVTVMVIIVMPLDNTFVSFDYLLFLMTTHVLLVFMDREVHK
jgi:hypothetical protein